MDDVVVVDDEHAESPGIAGASGVERGRPPSCQRLLPQRHRQAHPPAPLARRAVLEHPAVLERLEAGEAQAHAGAAAAAGARRR